MNTMFKKIATGTAALALMTTVFASGALAAETSTAISGGSVGVSDITTTTFTSVTLDGTTQSTTAQLNTFDATDARGTGEGWKVNVKASQFTDTVKGKVLQNGSLEIAAPAVSLKDTGSSSLDTITTAGGIIDNATGVKLVSAKLDGGMGSYTVAPAAMTLTLKPGAVYAGDYKSTVTVELTTGP